MSDTNTVAMDCNRIVTAQVRSQYLANMTLSPSATAQSGTMMCRLEGQQGRVSMIEATCGTQTATATDAATIKRDNPNAKDVNNLGKSAVMIDNGTSKDLQAWDADSDCHIHINVPENVDAVAVGRAVLDQLPPRG